MAITVIKQPLWQRIILLFVLGYEGLGGIIGGFFLIIQPDGHLMQMPVEIMHGTFSNFLFPGILLSILGLLNVFAFIQVFQRNINDWMYACLANGSFYIWFIVEIIILRELHILHLLWGLPVLFGCMMSIPLAIIKNEKKSIQHSLIYCGLISCLWYIAINVIVPVYYEGYSLKTLTVSELSAIAAPTRILWVLLVSIYPLLFGAFGWAVIKISGDNSRLRLIGVFIIAYCMFNFYWPPMHMRGEGPTFTDLFHIVWASVTVFLMITMMIIGMFALDKRFMIFTIVSLLLLIVFGALTFSESSNIPINEPTPFIGIWERINIGIFMIWVIAFSKMLLKNYTKAELKNINIKFPVLDLSKK
jgi:hypothetical protein